MILLGIIGEYIGKMYIENKKRPSSLRSIRSSGMVAAKELHAIDFAPQKLRIETASKEFGSFSPRSQSWYEARAWIRSSWVFSCMM